jgi:ribosomal protein L24
MTKGDKVKVFRGPLAGHVVELMRHNKAAGGWMAKLSDDTTVMVWDYELAETLERKPKGKVKR